MLKLKEAMKPFAFDMAVVLALAVTMGSAGVMKASKVIERAESPVFVSLSEAQYEVVTKSIASYIGESEQVTKRRSDRLIKHHDGSTTIDVDTLSGTHRILLHLEGGEAIVKDAWRI